MKLWKLLTLVLAVCLLGSCLLACGGDVETTPEDVGGEETPGLETTNPETTEPETTEPETTKPETTEPETTEFVCQHPNMTETVLLEASCTAVGEIEKKCEDCDFMERITTDFAHEDTQSYSEELCVTENTCANCKDTSVVVEAGKRVKLSAYCEGALSFSLVGAASNESLEVLVDGESLGKVSFDESGKATVSIEALALGAHSIVFVNGGESAVRVKLKDEINGHFNRPGAMYIEVLGCGNLEYSSFNVYLQTSDPSGEYYICYPFLYKYDPKPDVYTANSCYNIGSYRLNGAQLCRITFADDDRISKSVVETVLGSGEISYAVMQRNAYQDELAEAAKPFMAEDGSAPDFIGGYHGDEWLDSLCLLADGDEVDLKSREKYVIPCSTVVFDLNTTMYAWGTSSAESRGVPAIEHMQTFVMDSAGVDHLQKIRWLRGDFVIKAGYMPMFTMMRGRFGNYFIDTMRSYDENGNVLGEYVMPAEEVTSQYGVLSGSNVTRYDYLGSKGISGTISFRMESDAVRMAGSYIAIRPGADNKLYATPTSVLNSSCPAQDELWAVRAIHKIDYIKPIE